MDLTTESSSDDIVRHRITLGDVTGVLWSPAQPADGAPLLLMGHGGGLSSRAPGTVARAENTVRREGFHVAAVDAPGHGGRERPPADQRLVDAMLRARRAGESPVPAIVELNVSLAERAVPEWRAVLDALLARPGIDPDAPVGYAGMTLGAMVGLPLIAAERRIRAATVGGAFACPSILDAARAIAVPVDYLLPWADPEIPREHGLAVFDALGSAEKTLLAFPESHKRMPGDRLDTGLFRRHLSR